MINPEDIKLIRADGTPVTLVVAKIPAIPAREILTQYIPTLAPRIGDYQSNEVLMRKLLAFAGVRQDDGSVLMLDMDAAINNHLVDWETLVKAEIEMLQYNCTFLKRDGLQWLLEQAKAIVPKVMKAEG